MIVPKYKQLTCLLGVSHDSDEFRSATGGMPTKSLGKDGGFKARVSYQESGIVLYFEYCPSEWLCQSVMLYPGGVEDFSRYPHEIEDGLSLSSARADVRAVLGTPAATGGGGPPLLNVLVDYHWDRYDRDGYSVRIEYDEEQGQIRLITLMAPMLVARLSG